MARRGDGPDDEEFAGADWLLGQLEGDDEPEAPQETPEAPRAAPEAPRVSEPPRAAPESPRTVAEPQQPTPASPWSASTPPATPVPDPATPRGESLDWFSLAEASAPPISFEQPPRPAPDAPAGEPDSRGLAPAWGAPRWSPSDSGQPPADPVLTSVEPPVTGNVDAQSPVGPETPESPAVPGPVTPAAPFALTWGDEPAQAATPVVPTQPEPSQPEPAPVEPPVSRQSFVPVSTEPQPLLDAPRTPRSWDELAAASVAAAVAPARDVAEPVVPEPVVPEPVGAEPDGAEPVVPTPRAAEPDASASPIVPPPAVAQQFDEELWSALQEPERPEAPASIDDGTAEVATVAGAGSAAGEPPATRPPFPAFASADRVPPTEAPTAAVDDLLAAIGGGSAAAVPATAAGTPVRGEVPEGAPTSAVDELLAAIGGGSAAAAAAPAADEPAADEPATPGQQVIGDAFAGSARGDIDAFAGEESDASDASEASDAEPGYAWNLVPDLSAADPRADQGPIATAALAAEALAAEALPSGLGALVDPSEEDDPLPSSGLGSLVTAQSGEIEPLPSSGLGALVNPSPDATSEPLLTPSASTSAFAAFGASGAAASGAAASDAAMIGAAASDAAMIGAAASDAAMIGTATTDAAMSGAATTGAAPSGASGASAANRAGGAGASADLRAPGSPTGGGRTGGSGGAEGSGGSSGGAADRKRRTLIGVAGGLALLLVLAGLFFLGTKLPLGGTAAPAASSPASTSDPAPETTNPVAAQPAGVHAWNTLFGGECLDPFTDAWAEEFTVVDCAAPHPAQLVLRGTIAADAAAAFPGEAELAAQLAATCRAAGVFDAAAIATLDDLQVLSSYPLAEQWAAGERTFYCFANRSSGEPLTGSIAGPTPSQVVEAQPVAG